MIAGGMHVMTDSATRKRVCVLVDAASGPYIMVSRDQLDLVLKVLSENNIPHWASHLAVSVDGGPMIVDVYVGKRTDPQSVQALLDAVA
jgi:hypothetical protein